MLCVAGEAGMGKTTLVDEFIHQIGGSTGVWSIARGRCSERLAGAEGYLPFLEALDHLIRNDPGQTLAHLLKTTAPGWYSQVATASSRDTPAGGLVPETAAAAQQRMKRELGVFFEEATRLRPMVLCLDDLHWADLSTVDLLAYLGPKLPSMRLLLIGAYRPAELLLGKHPFLPVRQELQAHGTCREVALDFLTLEDVERYLAVEFPNHLFPPELPALVHARTEGNALFMVNLVRYLVDNRVIGRQGDPPGDRWVLLQPLAEIERDMPESVRSMIQRKIDRLDPVDRRLLAAAALQGLEFDSAVLSKALAMDPVEVEDRLEEIERGHAIIRRLGEAEHPDRTLTLRCGFVYGVYQDALHDLLTPARRALVSGGVAQALEQFYGARKTEIASQLALLLETAREFSRASEYFLLAAQHALKVCANQEAAAMARRGIEAIRTAPASPERSKHELRLQTALAMASMAISYSADEVATALGRSRELCQELGDNLKLLGVMGGLHGYHSVRAHHLTALELGEQMLQLAEQMKEPRRLAQAHYFVGSSLLDTGKPLEALEHFKQGIAFTQPNPSGAEPVHNPAVTCRCYAARALIFLGRSQESFQMIQEALDISKKMRHPINYTFALMIASFLHQHHRDWRKAEEHATAMTVLARENGFQYLTAFGFILEGWALSEQGSLEEGAARLRKGIQAFEAVGAEVGRPHYRALLADTLARLGQVDEALATIHDALEGVERTGERYYEAEIHRVHGQLLARSNDPAAEETLRRAVQVAAGQCARAFELRAAIRLAAFLAGRNQKGEARDVLAPVFAYFNGAPETPDLRDAKALLDEVG
jgi:predicted ATPase